MDPPNCFYCDAYPFRVIKVMKFANCRLAVPDADGPTESIWICDVTTESLCCRKCYGGGDPDAPGLPQISVIVSHHNCQQELWWNQEVQDMLDDPSYNDGVRSTLKLKLRHRLFPKQ